MFSPTLLTVLLYVFRVDAEVMSPVNQNVGSTTSNASTQLFTNTSLSPPSSFSYIIPYGQPQECDIYGPICQTGSITVGVNLTTATTITTLPCSSYLSEQSSYLLPQSLDTGLFDMEEMPDEWLLNFGRSPECRSYAAEVSYAAEWGDAAHGNGLYTISGCGDQYTVTGSNDDGTYPTQLPPGVVRRISPTYNALCCGNCSLDVSEVRLYYFPDRSTPNCQYNQTFNSSSTLSGQRPEKREHSLIKSGSTAVTGGYTFTSPSVYLEIVGTAAVSDDCNTLGPILTNPIMSFPPGVLETWKPGPASDYDEYETFAVGDVWQDPIQDPNAPIFSAPLAIRDLACPTWGLGRNTNANGTVITTIGPPWLPLIIPPVQAFTLDPTWASICSGILTDQFELTTFALFDPPIALTPGLGLVPQPAASVIAPTSLPAPNVADPTTVQEKSVAPSISVAKPASSPADPAGPPARTAEPVENSASSLLASSGDPARPASLHEEPLASPTDNKNDASVGSRTPQPGASVVSAGGINDPPASLRATSSEVAPEDPKAPGLPPLQSLGAIIYNAFGKSGPDTGGIENEVNTITVPTAETQEITIGGGQVLSIDPSGVNFEGKTYSVGGPAMTLSNKVYTLIPQHGSDNDTSNDDHDTAFYSPPPAPDTLTIAGHTVVPNPIGMVIAGSSVSPGGSAITISSTPISLDPAGVLSVGSSSFSLPTRSIFTVGAHTFTAAPTGFVLNGATISPGATAQWVDSTRVSLGLSGALAIGSSTILLPTLSSTSTATNIYTVAGQYFTPNPSVFSIAGTTISAGGPAVTVAGTIVRLGQSGILTIGGTTVSLQTPSPAFSADSPFTVAGQTFTPNPSAFSIAGTTISAGGSAVTISGTVISLQPSATLIVGSSTIPLSASQTPIPALTNIDGLDVEAQSSVAIVDGMTISPGSSGVTVDGHNVSLEAGGKTLDIGTERFAIPTATDDGSAGVLAFEGGQSRTVKVSTVTLLIFGIVWSLMLLM